MLTVVTTSNPSLTHSLSHPPLLHLPCVFCQPLIPFPNIQATPKTPPPSIKLTPVGNHPLLHPPCAFQAATAAAPAAVLQAWPGWQLAAWPSAQRTETRLHVMRCVCCRMCVCVRACVCLVCGERMCGKWSLCERVCACRQAAAFACHRKTGSGRAWASTWMTMPDIQF
jgi:hypothetical protein